MFEDANCIIFNTMSPGVVAELVWWQNYILWCGGREQNNHLKGRDDHLEGANRIIPWWLFSTTVNKKQNMNQSSALGSGSGSGCITHSILSPTGPGSLLNLQSM